MIVSAVAAGFFGLVRQQLGEMRGMKPRVDRRGGVESGNGAEDGVLLRRQHERLAERLEPPIGPVHAHHDAREHTHPITIKAQVLTRFPAGVSHSDRTAGDTPGVPVASEPWRRPSPDVAAELVTDVSRGLTSAEAALRLARYGPNELEAAAAVPAWRKFLAQFADPLIYLLLAAVVVSLVAWVAEGAEGVPYEAIVIAVIVVLNAVLGYVQEARAEQAVAALQRMAAPTARRRARRARQRVPADGRRPGRRARAGGGRRGQRRRPARRRLPR